MNMPHNFWLGLGCWVFGTIIMIRMFWIFPWWATRLSSGAKGVISFLLVLVFVLIFWKPVMLAYEKKTADTEGNSLAANKSAQQSTQQSTPAPAAQGSSPTSHKNKKSAVQTQTSTGPSATSTQIGTAQGPVAVAPNGIANAAPNLGSQTVNNFEPPAPNVVATSFPSEKQTQRDGQPDAYKTKFTIKTDRETDFLSFRLAFDGPYSSAQVETSYTPSIAYSSRGGDMNGHPALEFSITYPKTLSPGGEINVFAYSAQPLKMVLFGRGP